MWFVGGELEREVLGKLGGGLGAVFGVDETRWWIVGRRSKLEMLQG